MEGEQPYLGDLLTMVINHLLTGMILQVPLFSETSIYIQKPVDPRITQVITKESPKLHPFDHFQDTPGVDEGNFPKNKKKNSMKNDKP